MGVQKKGDQSRDRNYQLDEIVSLCRTAGAEVVGHLTQMVERLNPSTLLGSGKVEELKAYAGDKKANLLVFDSPYPRLSR